MSYLLYSTFAVDGTTKSMTAKQKRELCTSLNSLTERDKIDAVFLLITEHFRRESNQSINIGDFQMPYGGKEKDNGITFDVDKFPQVLCWVLWKFLGKPI